jgi:hypothetical protein
MTITYANGTVRKAIMLSHKQDEIRAVTSASDDAQILRRVEDTWFSEGLRRLRRLRSRAPPTLLPPHDIIRIASCPSYRTGENRAGIHRLGCTQGTGNRG